MKIRTDKRLYKIEPLTDSELNIVAWDASYRPLNPKTGNPWQADRGVNGYNGYLHGYRGDSLHFVEGEIPPHTDWPINTIYMRRAYKTQQDALAAVHAFDPSTLQGTIT